MQALVRKFASKIRSDFFRRMISVITVLAVYTPFICVGKILKPLGLSHHIPLFEIYNEKSIRRIEQDAYDRIFTSIEQRGTKKQIMELNDSFSKIIISEHLPYWHFRCENGTDFHDKKD